MILNFSFNSGQTHGTPDISVNIMYFSVSKAIAILGYCQYNIVVSISAQYSVSSSSAVVVLLCVGIWVKLNKYNMIIWSFFVSTRSSYYLTQYRK